MKSILKANVLTQDQLNEKRNEALNFVNSLQIPEHTEETILLGESFGSDTSVNTANVNDHQLQSFIAGINPQLKSDVLNSTLLAQLAADKQYPADDKGKYDVMGWYSYFSRVLHNIGWVVEQNSFREYQTTGASFSADKAIIEVLQGVITGNPLVLASATLEGLKKMSSTSPAVSIFKRCTERDQVGNFGMGVCYEVEGSISMGFAAMYLDTQKSINHILFYDFSSSDYKLNTGTYKMILNNDVYNAVRSAVLSKLGDRASSYIAELEI